MRAWMEHETTGNDPRLAAPGAAAMSEQPGAGCLGVCCVVSLVLAVGFLLLGIWATQQDERFSPVYDAISCRFGDVGIKGLRGSIWSGISLGLATELICSNPNDYSLFLDEPSEGYVYIGEERSKVAILTTAPQTLVPAKGSVAVPINGEIDLGLSALMSMLPVLTASQVSVYLDPAIELDIDVSFFLAAGYQTKKIIVLRCGFNMEGFGGNIATIVSAMSSFEPNIGDVACADEWSQLKLDPVGVSNVTIGAFLLDLDAEETEDLEQLKTTALGTAQGLAYGLCALLAVASLLCCGRLLRRRRLRRPTEDEGLTVPPPKVIGATS